MARKPPANLIEALILLGQQQDDEEAIKQAELTVQKAEMERRAKGGR